MQAATAIQPLVGIPSPGAAGTWSSAIRSRPATRHRSSRQPAPPGEGWGSLVCSGDADVVVCRCLAVARRVGLAPE